MLLRTYLKQIVEERAVLGRQEASALMQAMLTGQSSDVEIAGLLGALAGRGETAEEIAGFVDAMREAATALPLTDAERDDLVDVCGTGGDGSGTFNISTAAALVAAAAGAKVAKHGNRAVTSTCGSADVLDALGIPVGLSGEAAAHALRQHGFCFLMASAHHPAMRAVMPVRKALGVRTVFNLLGPLTNPAGARRQVMGVYGLQQVELVAQAMMLLGVRHGMVVHGQSGNGTGMDEFSIAGASRLAEVLEEVVTMKSFTPEEAGLRRAEPGQLQGGDAPANALILQSIFAGEQGPRRDVVVINAAALLVVAGIASDIKAGVDLASTTIDLGKVTLLIEALR